MSTQSIHSINMKRRAVRSLVLLNEFGAFIVFDDGLLLMIVGINMNILWSFISYSTVFLFWTSFSPG